MDPTTPPVTIITWQHIILACIQVFGSIVVAYITTRVHKRNGHHD